MKIVSVAVIGAGTMGRGIIETAATSGFTVYACEVDAQQRHNAQEQIGRAIARHVDRGTLAADLAQEVQARIRWSDALEGVRDADFVIEAVAEQQSLKTKIFAELDRTCPPQAILASNTSSISISRLAEATNRAGQVVGMHFFNPVPVMQPVEIVRGEKTTEETIGLTRMLAEQMGKVAFVVRDRPGFVVNRVLMPLINEAVFALQDEVADAETIDSLMKLGCNHPMGPLRLADLVGLDICVSILSVLQRDLQDDKFAPCPLLVQMVDEGKLGRKVGQGFYKY